MKQIPPSGPDGVEAMNRILAKSAPLARDWAQEYCWRNPADRKRCDWYHGSWQTLRLLGVITTLTSQAELYVTALRQLARSGDFERIFLSGSADFGLLAVVLDAYQREGIRPDVTLVDRCETPLRLSRWFAEQFGYPVNTVRCDLTAFRSQLPFDIVCAHSLLSCVPREGHREITETWRRQLRPGGMLLMANNFYPGSQETKNSFSPEQVDAYAERIAALVDGCPYPDALPPLDELVALAKAFASNMEGSIFRSQDELSELLESSGFEVTELLSGTQVTRQDHQSTGAPIKGKRDYAWIVAKRR